MYERRNRVSSLSKRQTWHSTSCSHAATTVLRVVNMARDQAESNQWTDWHKRFGHISYTGLKQLYQQGLVDGMSVDENSPTPDCEACICNAVLNIVFIFSFLLPSSLPPHLHLQLPCTRSQHG
ncbi:hypothetical protein K503DRAFT_311211 [Rhizopogon vinicolor AM-OR11-026]|uniref:GAG-pre-integrase domain-containing protein n=1 Tax=Rhizopogon vinicolor AM-OR11-026 TaxID=1314800 RepID=A0A1B7MUU2_9AGAM|nr:hypothetical protein K503DRAFT_311211 [Rhizopogon vinicolor AM-OR11-026]